MKALLKLWLWLEFALFYAREIIRANVRVAIDVLTPQVLARPDLVEVDLDPDLTDLQLTVLANLITFTPGTLSLDVSEDRKVLLVHAMYLDDHEAFNRTVKNDFERRVKRLL